MNLYITEKKKPLTNGITGQDGSHLVELLLEKKFIMFMV